jgi:hypothetical protein
MHYETGMGFSKSENNSQPFMMDSSIGVACIYIVRCMSWCKDWIVMVGISGFSYLYQAFIGFYCCVMVCFLELHFPSSLVLLFSSFKLK